MLRRRLQQHPNQQLVANLGSGSATAAAAPSSSSSLVCLYQHQQRAFMGGMFGGKKKKEEEAHGDKDAPGAGGGFPGMGAIPGFDAKRMKDFMGKSPEDQVKFMRDALEMQKKVGGKVPGLGKLNNMNVKMMEQMVSGLESTVGKKEDTTAATTSPTTTTTTTPKGDSKGAWKAPNNGGGGAASSSGASRTASPMQSAQPVSRDPPQGGPNSFKNASGPTLDELRKISLGPEIEELFSELRLMRGKRDSYRAQMDKSEIALKYTASELKETQDKVADLRKRLGGSEQSVTKLTSENIALQQKATELQQVQSQVRTLNTTVSALKGNDTAPLADKIAQLEKALAVSNDARKSLQRKLDRARRKDPVLQFSLLVLTELASRKNVIRHSWSHRQDATSGGVGADQQSGSEFLMCQPLESLQFSSGADATLPASDIVSSVAEESFSALQEVFTKSTDSVWAASCGSASARALVLASSDYIATHIGRPLSSLDAIVTLGKGHTSLPPGLISALEAQGFVIERIAAASEQGGSGGDGNVSLVVKAAGALSASFGFLGPYGFCKLVGDFIRLGGGGDSYVAVLELLGGGDARTLSEAIVSVIPTVTTSLANDTRRSKVEIHTSRSSGPGGQAANVGETQITVNLLIDGVHLLTSECQDSRSAMTNKDMALKRLYGEKLDRFNKQTLSRVKVPEVFVPSHLAATTTAAPPSKKDTVDAKSGITTDQWNSLCGAAEAHLVKEGKLIELCCVLAAKDVLSVPPIE